MSFYLKKKIYGALPLQKHEGEIAKKQTDTMSHSLQQSLHSATACKGFIHFSLKLSQGSAEASFNNEIDKNNEHKKSIFNDFILLTEKN